MPERDDIPGTIRRSPPSAQDTWAKAHDAAVGSYGEGEHAHRVAYAALKHTHEKVGDHWARKDEAGPSDAQAAQGGREALEHPKETFGGVDVRGSTKAELLARARDLDVRGRSSMSKAELGRAIARRQD